MRKYPLYLTDRIRSLKKLIRISTRRCLKKEALEKLAVTSDYKTVSCGQLSRGMRPANAFLDLGYPASRATHIGENSYQNVLTYFARINSNIFTPELPPETKLPADFDIGILNLRNLFVRMGTLLIGKCRQGYRKG